MAAKAPQDLNKLLESVNDESTFIAFVQALADDFAAERRIETAVPSGDYGRGTLGWENGTVDAVLERAAAWGETGLHAADMNPWRRCAHILYAGKWYE